MPRTRTPQLAGTVCLIVAASTLLMGSSAGPPWLSLVAAVVGAVLLFFGLARDGSEPGSAAPVRGERRRRLARITLIGIGALGVVGLVVALAVAVGDAQGHAIFHLLTGSFCLGLFALLAFAWHPREGGTASSLQGFVLLLLAVAAAAQYVESLGGSGYDAANGGHRIEALTALHGVGVAFGGIVLVAVPLGLLTAAGVVIAGAARRARDLRT